MSEARRFQQQQQRGTISSLIRPDNGVRGKQERMGIKPKDFMKENVRDMRQVQVKNRNDKEEAARPQKELYKLSQFKDVESRLNEKPEHQTARRRSFNDGQFLQRGVSDKRRMELARESRAHREEVMRKIEEAKYYAERPPTPKKSAVPRSDEVNRLAPESNVDFIHRNKVKALTMAPAHKASQKAEEGLHDSFGRVPDYLLDRQQQWAEEEEERRRNLPDPDCPPGMCVMPEDERVSTLETLKRSKADAMEQLRRMPFVIETPSQRKKQDFLEGKLREIDSALAIFSKPKVFVAMDR